MPGNRLRPHAEGAERWTAACGVERNERMKQEGHVVALDLQIALIDITREWERIQFFLVQLGPLRVVHDLAVFSIANAQNLAERLPVRVFNSRMIELPARHEIDV